jgi:hypothetical protein
VLDVPISFFFDDQPDTLFGAAYEDVRFPGPPAAFGEALPAAALGRRETLELIRAYQGIADPTQRKILLDLIRLLGTASAG